MYAALSSFSGNRPVDLQADRRYGHFVESISMGSEYVRTINTVMVVNRKQANAVQSILEKCGSNITASCCLVSATSSNTRSSLPTRNPVMNPHTDCDNFWKRF